jgi:hypothetical protein
MMAAAAAVVAEIGAAPVEIEDVRLVFEAFAALQEHI